MKVARKILITGGASLVLAGGIIALPASLPVGATYGSHSPTRHTNDSYVLKEESNATYNVKTEISPSRHVIWSTVTNKSNASLTPTVTFNGEQAIAYKNKPLDPGKSKKYVHAFTGNNFTLDVTVAAEGLDPFTSSAVVNLPEPVSFKTTTIDQSNKTVTGTLTNNTADPQTVYIKEGRKNKTTETLNPNESKTITVSSSHASQKDNRHWGSDHDRHDHKFVHFSVSTQAGYKGSYIIPLGYQIDEPTPVEN